jgi:hypothetical protein
MATLSQLTHGLKWLCSSSSKLLLVIVSTEALGLGAPWGLIAIILFFADFYVFEMGPLIRRKRGVITTGHSSLNDSWSIEFSSLQFSKFRLGLASTVVHGFEPRRDPWPKSYSFQYRWGVWKCNILFDDRSLSSWVDATFVAPYFLKSAPALAQRPGLYTQPRHGPHRRHPYQQFYNCRGPLPSDCLLVYRAIPTRQIIFK